MSPETAELIEEIAEARERTRPLLAEAKKDVQDADEILARVLRDLEAGDIEVEQAQETLRRAGLLPS